MSVKVGKIKTFLNFLDKMYYIVPLPINKIEDIKIIFKKVHKQSDNIIYQKLLENFILIYYLLFCNLFDS